MGKQREKTVSLTANQLREIAKEPKIGIAIAQQIDATEGIVRGNLAFKVATMLNNIVEGKETLE